MQLVRAPLAQFRFGGIDERAVAVGVDERAAGVLRSGARDELAVPVSLDLPMSIT
jgi:hypothetical protein